MRNPSSECRSRQLRGTLTLFPVTAKADSTVTEPASEFWLTLAA